jgi:hypothetical protein
MSEKFVELARSREMEKWLESFSASRNKISSVHNSALELPVPNISELCCLDEK